MMKLSFSVVALIALTALAIFAPSLVAHAQRAARFEYSRVTPYGLWQNEGNVRHMRVGYRACLAATDEWTCRDFKPQESSDAALRTALSTLGNEGWELVSVVSEDPNPSPYGLTYLFKRPQQ